MKTKFILISCCLLLATSPAAAHDVEPAQPPRAGSPAEFKLEVTVGPPRGAVRIPPGDAPSWPYVVSVRAVHRPPDGEDGVFISIRNIEVYPGEETQRQRSQDGYQLLCSSTIDDTAKTADVSVRLVHDGRFILDQAIAVRLAPIPPGE